MERFIFGAPENHGQNERNAEEETNDKLHSEDLFDQDEDRAGEKINLATGEAIDNSTYTGFEALSVVDETVEDESDVTPGERWLRENDPDHPRYTGKK